MRTSPSVGVGAGAVGWVNEAYGAAETQERKPGAGTVLAPPLQVALGWLHRRYPSAVRSDVRADS